MNVITNPCPNTDADLIILVKGFSDYKLIVA